MFRLFVFSALIWVACGQKNNSQSTPTVAQPSVQTNSPSPQPSPQNDFSKFAGNYEFYMDGGKNAGGTAVFVGYMFNMKTAHNISISGDGYQTGFEVACRAEFVPNNPNSIELVLEAITRESSMDYLQEKLDKKERVVFATVNKLDNKLQFSSEYIYDNKDACKNCALIAVGK